MSDEGYLAGPRRLLSNALHAVKGDSTQSLVENFTSEMTLVAEGLCEDQAKLRTQLEDLERREDRDRQRLTEETDTIRSDLEADIHALSGRLDDLSARLGKLEAASAEASRKQEKKKRLGLDGLMRSLIVLAGIVCGAWVLVTILNLFKP